MEKTSFTGISNQVPFKYKMLNLLKKANILIDNKRDLSTIKIADFGLSAEFTYEEDVN